MSGRILAVLACKILALYVFIKAIEDLNLLIVFSNAFNSGMEPGALIFLLASAFLPLILLGALGYILWTRSDKIAEHMAAAGQTDSDGDREISVHEIQAAAFSVVGVLVLADAIPEIVHQVANYASMRQGQYMGAEWQNPSFISRAASSLVKLAIGLWLFLGSRGIVGMAGLLREAGLRKQE